MARIRGGGILLVASLQAAAGCLGSGSPAAGTGSTSAGANGSSTGGTANSGGSTTESGFTSSGGSTGTSGGSSTGGSSTGAAARSPYPDAGFVFCTAITDAGNALWLCPPDTSFCDAAAPGNCFECRSDSDCADTALPGYDLRRSRCDLHSGVTGYQNFCQQCLADADCAGNPAGSIRNLDLVLGGVSQPPIVSGGFEVCLSFQTDCALDGGPPCDGLDQTCDAEQGSCVARSQNCTSDQDCAGLIPTAYLYLPTPYCEDFQCSACNEPRCFPLLGCNSDATCGNPASSDAGLTCAVAIGACGCTSSAQCGSFWPACVNLDAGFVNEFGETNGFCGCVSGEQCGDAGLICVQDYEVGLGHCGEPCTAPGFPACSKMFGIWPICDRDSGLCTPCNSDQECAGGLDTGGDVCLLDAGGLCGCLTNADCHGGRTCQAQAPGNSACVFALPSCNPVSCPGNSFCDWDSGACVNSPLCLQDGDCGPGAPFCDQGQCVICRNNADCLKNGLAVQGLPTCCTTDAGCSFNDCLGTCRSDGDCAAVPGRSACIGLDGGDVYDTTYCGCGSDTDCAGNRAGSHCNAEPGSYYQGYCACATGSECPLGYGCRIDVSGTLGRCTNQCTSDSQCGPGTFCDADYGQCHPRCDTGHACTDREPVCDTANVVGANGQTLAGAAPGVTWCYQCLTASDCQPGQTCTYESCGSCVTDKDCPADQACMDGGCAAKCDVNPCPPGLACDRLGIGRPPDVCLPCVTAADCPYNQGCSGTCGTCADSTQCPAGNICSNYWMQHQECEAFDECALPTLGVCLANCDASSCPADRPRCAVIPSLTVSHDYCVACLADSDCADAGAGAWCDVSVKRTYTCQPPP